jgi:1-acyl-sn-glycerol-3-phosphate acyltransferase
MRASGGLAPSSPVHGALAASRLLRLSGRALEAIGRARMQAPTLRARAEQLRDSCAAVCALHGFDVRAIGVLPSGPAIYVSNHLSWADAPVLASLSPCAPIAKAEVARWPLVGAGARSLGVIFVRRESGLSGARALRQAWRALDGGVSVLGFPEGTTSTELRPFRRGLFGLARLACVPIVPLAIAYEHPDVAWLGDEWFLPHYFRTAMRPRTRVFVRVGAPLSPRAASCAEDLAELCRARIADLQGRLS